MTDFNDFKNKVLVSIGKAADAGKDIAGKAAEKAKAGTRIAKLSVDIAGEKDNMKKAYIEMGKLYYDTHKDDPEGFFIQLCEEVTLAQKNIAEKEAEIDALKNGGAGDDPDIDVEFEDVVSDDESAHDAAPEDAPDTGDGAPKDKDEE